MNLFYLHSTWHGKVLHMATTPKKGQSVYYEAEPSSCLVNVYTKVTM